MFNNNNLLNKLFNRVLKVIIVIVLTSIIIVFITGNIVSITCVSGRSMEPNFFNNDKLIINRRKFFKDDLKVGDVIVFNECRKKNTVIYNMKEKLKDILDGFKFNLNLCKQLNRDNYIKRVVAIEGDRVDIRDGKFYINGSEEKGYNVRGNTYNYGGYKFPRKVPIGKVLVLGDNRENSLDSRLLGFIDKCGIKGRVLCRILPVKRIENLDLAGGYE